MLSVTTPEPRIYTNIPAVCSGTVDLRHCDSYTTRALHSRHVRIPSKLNVFNASVIKLEVEAGKQHRNRKKQFRIGKTGSLDGVSAEANNPRVNSLLPQAASWRNVRTAQNTAPTSSLAQDPRIALVRTNRSREIVLVMEHGRMRHANGRAGRNLPVLVLQHSVERDSRRS